MLSPSARSHLKPSTCPKACLQLLDAIVGEVQLSQLQALPHPTHAAQTVALQAEAVQVGQPAQQTPQAQSPCMLVGQVGECRLVSSTEHQPHGNTAMKAEHGAQLIALAQATQPAREACVC